MSIRSLTKAVLPNRVLEHVQRWRRWCDKQRLEAFPKLDQNEFRRLLREQLDLRRGDIVFVHSSVQRLNLAFSPFLVLDLLREVVGSDGTLVFPTYNRTAAYDFLRSGELFDVRASLSYTGILTELARRQPDARRSLHPTKSVCALGPAAESLTADHHRSRYPYDRCSPYYRLAELDGKVLGLGVSTRYLSLMHSIEDILGEAFPVLPYHAEAFAAKCIDYDGQVVVVETFAHDLSKMKHNVPRFIRRYISADIAEDLTIGGMPMFRAHARPLFEAGVALARQNITIYPRKVYKSQE